MTGIPEGLYEALRTVGLDRQVSELVGAEPHFDDVPQAAVSDVLARHVGAVVRATLASAPTQERVRLANAVLDAVRPRVGANSDAHILEPVQHLIAVTHIVAPGVYALDPSMRPSIPLSNSALLTNAADEVALGNELNSELASADGVDLLCAFIRWTGIRILAPQLEEVHRRGVPIRIITTTYMGATERRALDELVRRFGATVKVSYETQSTRLHAKAWLFRRHSGFDTGFVGSSNLSKAALLDGLEWNVRISGVLNPELIAKFEVTFDSYWAEPAFVDYDPDLHAGRLDAALAAAGAYGSLRRGGSTPVVPTLLVAAEGDIPGDDPLAVTPFPHQEQMLEALQAEREHGKHRNLVVAATGTGKTVVAALDYLRLSDAGAARPSLLFVAHRQEILQQALSTYRRVLADGAFGELFVDGQRPTRWRHVFASVQSLSDAALTDLESNSFDIIVIDEFHHAEASSYRRVLDHFDPRELLGLTATPERSDGVDVRDEFFAGRTAAELRLWDALSADLLVPFHYFGVADDVDLSGVTWTRGAYDIAGLDKLYTGNDARAAKVLRELRHKVSDVHQMRALGFCVSVAHAEYMARVFTDAGIEARAVSGGTASATRAAALGALRDGTVNILFAADLFNEGVDLPEVDTVLFLRPTQSATVFLQQLGRGLRRAPDKSVLTVLDFIGQHRREFRFDVRYVALLGGTRAGLEKQIESGFPHLPSGTQMQLDRVAQQIVLDNVRAQVSLRRPALATELRSMGDVDLATYLREAGRTLGDVYRGNESWTGLRRTAGLPTPAAGPSEEHLLKRVSALVHVDDAERRDLYASLLGPDAPHYNELSDRQARLARMLFFALWPDKGKKDFDSGFASYNSGFAHLRLHRAVCEDITMAMDLAVDQSRLSAASLGNGLVHLPLLSHARYRRDEVLAGLQWARWDRVAKGHSTGVVWCEETQTDALFVNLRKSEKHFSPTTMYRDYALGPDLFHWESQNATSVDTPTGRRYLEHRKRGTHVVLFVRDTPTDDIGSAPFLCLGPVSYVEHSGDRPIAITWRLQRTMPADTLNTASVVAR